MYHLRDLVLVICTLALGCTSTHVLEDPIATMTDREAWFEKRRDAMTQARREMPNDPRRITALEQILWQPGYPAWQRREAVEDLVEHDASAFRHSLARRIVLLNDWKTLKYILRLAVDGNWADTTPAIVRNYARRAKNIADADRPERRALEKLNPGKSAEQVVFDVFASADDSTSFRQQVAAWELLARLMKPGKLIKQLEIAPSRSPLVIDLKHAAAHLGVLPTAREGVIWLQHWGDPARTALYEAAAAAAAKLDNAQRRSLELRHLPVLMRLESSDFDLTRTQLVTQIHRAAQSANRYMIGPTYDGGARDWPQRFTAWSDQMSWGDLITLRVVMRAMRDRDLVATFFAQADRDRDDKSTEYGGVLDVVDDRFVAMQYEPFIRKHDLKFIPSQKMIDRLYTAIAHYHFHAQRYKNKRYAGPGFGDLKLADRLPFNYVVFTFIDRDRLNVDYYQRGRIVVDLGTIQR